MNKLLQLMNNRVQRVNYNNLSKDWIIGFTEAEGGFYGKNRNKIFSISRPTGGWLVLIAFYKKQIRCRKSYTCYMETSQMGCWIYS